MPLRNQFDSEAEWMQHMRMYFAAKAMQGICAHHDTWGFIVDEIVGQSYAIADSMLAAREVRP